MINLSLNTIEKDKVLLNKLKLGDRNTFRLIYATYYNELCAYIFSFTNKDSITEDIVQDVLMKLWEKRSSLTIHTSIKSYLYRSVYYRYIDHYRKKKKTVEKLEVIRFETLNEMFQNDENKIELQLIQLRKAIEELPKRGKEVLVLSKFEGYKYHEIALSLDISINTVESHMARVMKLLRKKLGVGVNQVLFLMFEIKNDNKSI